MEKKWREILEREGWKNIEVAKDPAGMHYPPHTHGMAVSHLVLEGEMELTIAGDKKILRAGDRLDAPPGVLHEATIGASGCKYIVAEK